MSKVTEWFPGDVKPIRLGVYERKLGFGSRVTAFYAWNGEFWEYGGVDSPSQVSRSRTSSLDQSLPWRGLATCPSKRGKQ